MNSLEILQTLTARAEEKLGSDAAAERRADIEQLAEDLAKLRSTLLDVDDEP